MCTDRSNCTRRRRDRDRTQAPRCCRTHGWWSCRCRAPDAPSTRGPRGRLFLLLALAFAVSAFLRWYALALCLALVLSGVVERVRMEHFGSLVPRALFSAGEPVSRKFHQAALLCLSIGLAMSSVVMLNSAYLHWWHIEKLKQLKHNYFP